MRSRLTVFTLLTMIILLTQASTLCTAGFSQADWIHSGMYVEYSCNITVYKGAPYAPSSGTFRWTIVNVTDVEIYVLYEMRIEDLSLEKSLRIDRSSNQIISVDGEPVENLKNYLWITYVPKIGGFIQLENLTAEVVDLRLISTRLFINRTCWVTNATFSIGGLNVGELKNVTLEGFIERTYDSETGILVSSRFLIEFKDSEGKVSQSYYLRAILSSTNIPRLGSRRSKLLPEAAAAIPITAALIILSTRILRRIRLA